MVTWHDDIGESHLATNGSAACHQMGELLLHLK